MAEGASPLRHSADNTASSCRVNGEPAEGEPEIQKYEAAEILCALAEHAGMPTDNTQGDWNAVSLRPQAAKRALAAAAEYQKHAQWLEGERRRLETELNGCLQKLQQSQSWMEKTQQQQEEQAQMRQELQAQVAALSCKLNESPASTSIAAASGAGSSSPLQHTPNRQQQQQQQSTPGSQVGNSGNQTTPQSGGDFHIVPKLGGSSTKGQGGNSTEMRDAMEARLNEECSALGQRYKSELLRIRTELHKRYLDKKSELERAAAVYYERKVLQDLQMIKAQVYTRKLQEIRDAVAMPPPPSASHPASNHHSSSHAASLGAPSHSGQSQGSQSMGGQVHPVLCSPAPPLATGPHPGHSHSSHSSHSSHTTQHGTPHSMPHNAQHNTQHNAQHNTSISHNGVVSHSSVHPSSTHSTPQHLPMPGSLLHTQPSPALLHAPNQGMHIMQQQDAAGMQSPMVVVGMPAGLLSGPIGWDPSYARWRAPEGMGLPVPPQSQR